MDESHIKYIDGAAILTLVVSGDDFKGVILGIKTSATGKLKLPNNDEYLIVFEKYTGVDEVKETARIQQYDWNHNKQLFCDVSVTEGQVDFENFYAINTAGALPSSCTGGADEDVSWGECMNCVKTVCRADPKCNSICKAINIISYLNFMLKIGTVSCTDSLAVGCVFVAIEN